LLFYRLDLGLQISKILFQRGETFLARVETAVEMPAMPALAATAMSMVMFFLAAARVTGPISTAAIVPAVPSLAAIVAVFAMPSATAIALITVAAVAVTVMMPTFVATHR